LRQAYDYWQDQPGWFSTEPKEQKQIEALKSKQKHTKTAKATNNKQNQSTTRMRNGRIFETSI